MMSQGKTPGKDPQGGLQGSEGSFQGIFTWKDPSDPCDPPWGSFPGTSLTVYSVHTKGIQELHNIFVAKSQPRWNQILGNNITNIFVTIGQSSFNNLLTFGNGQRANMNYYRAHDMFSRIFRIRIYKFFHQYLIFIS